MEKFYLTVIVGISFMYILKHFLPYHNKHENNQSSIDSNSINKEDEIPNERLNNSDISLEEKDFFNDEQMNTEEPARNRFLYSGEEYGKIGNDYSLNHYVNDNAIEDVNELNESKHVSIISIDDFPIVAVESSLEESLNELEQSKDETIAPENVQIATVETTKNKFLFTDDNFGKMEDGRSF